jgi:thioesterase domain-containing protein/O-antigen/teichoic acid export membrane protein/acyl carrier protein
MACYRPDGNIEFRGRTDHQVKMRGFRIELGEIETALERHPGVRESAATVVGDENKILAAWIVPSGAETPTARELRDFLASTLPDYMIPAVFHAVPAMPLTPNGKIDRRGLTRLENPIVRDREIIAPGDEIEARIVAILEKILQFRPIGIHDGFFELGGNSLLAIRLMGAIDEAFGRSFPLATLFQASTAAQIAAILRDPNEVAARGSLVVVQPLGAERPFFLVHGMGGHVLRFRALVRHFAPGQPVLALQAQGLSGEAPCLDRVEDMADRYLEEIRAVQRQGPYSLGGYSFGGFVALEIARRLEKLGEQVEYLALIDTFAGKPATKSSLLASLLRLSPLEQISYLSTKIRKKIRRMIAGVALPAPVKAVRQACADAERSYTPHVFKGKISLFLPSRKSLRNSPAEDGGWGELATAGVEVHEIPGDHGSIVDEPSAGELAKLILSGIDRSRLGQSKGEQARATEPGAANALSRPAVTELEKPATTLLGDTPAANGAIRPRSGEKAARWTAKGVFALTDQGLVSGSNFIISIVLARWLSPVEYGGFALVFAVFLLLSMAYQCLLLEPMAIYGVGEYGSRLRGYLKTLLVIHAVISGAILAILAASAEVAQLRGNAGGLPGALAGIGVAAPCILLFWLARRACYLNARSGVAAAGAVLYCASVMCGLWVAHSFVALSSFSAFLIMGVSGLLAAIVLFLLLNGSIVSTDPAPPARDAWRLHWGYGAWALGGAIASWIPAYIYYPLLGGFAGLGTVASLKALMNLAAPVMQLQAAFSMLLIPYAARRFRQGGAESVIGLGKLLTWGGLGCAVAYWLLIATFQHTIFHVLYAGRYAEVGALLPLAAIGSIFWAGTFGFSTALRAMERPRLIFIGFAIAAGVSLLAGIPATRMFGLTGAIWGINVSDLTAFLLLLIAVGRVRRTDDRDKLDWLSWPRNRTAAQPVNGTTK